MPAMGAVSFRKWRGQSCGSRAPGFFFEGVEGLRTLGFHVNSETLCVCSLYFAGVVLGISLGLGIPLLVCVIALVAWRCRKRR